VFYRLSYGDGLQSSPGQQTTTTINTFSPGVLFQVGERWTADYTPTWTLYSNSDFSNTVDHNININGQGAFTDGTIGFVQRYMTTNSPRIETGQQTHEETSFTSINVNYSLGRKTRLEFDVNQDLRFIENAPNSYEWLTQGWYHYQISSRVDAAAGIGFGYVAVEPGTDMTYLRPQVRLGWRTTDKLSFDAHLGAEHRKFHQEGAADLDSPTYGASAFYQPFSYTTLSLTGERGVVVSYFAGQVNQNITWTLGLNQRLLQHYYFNATAARTNTEYLPAGASTIVTTREDTSYTYSARLSTSILRRGTIGIVYQHVRNSSDISGYSFSSDQLGLEIGYRY